MRFKIQIFICRKNVVSAKILGKNGVSKPSKTLKYLQIPWNLLREGFHCREIAYEGGEVWNPTELIKFDMSDELKQQQIQKQISQALSFLKKQGIPVG